MIHPDALRNAQFDATLAALKNIWHEAGMGRRLDMMVERYYADKRAASLNPLVKAGQKYFSQNHEDGMTLEILRRIGKGSGTFVEFGVGDGLENNTLILLMNDWKGIWIGGEDLRISLSSDSRKLRYAKEWVTAENCVALLSQGLSNLGSSTVDFLSIDLDGNDFYVAEAIVGKGIRPSVIVVEYNAKFPPPIRWTIKYDPRHRWAGDDYQGASLQSFIDLFAEAGYRLVACDVTGTNAFFVHREFNGAFSDVPDDPAILFYPSDSPGFIRRGHDSSPRTIERFL